MGTKNVIKAHIHPMALKVEDELKKTADWKERSKLCGACKTRVSEFPAYFCNKCKILIHEGCAKLPLQVTQYSMHSEHPLHLVYKGVRPLLESLRYCNGCGTIIDECFTYRCLTCKFYICVLCGLSASKDRMLQHDSHPHPLMHVPKRAEFYCEACDRVDSAWSSYVCTTCPFWIHDICAKLPTTDQTERHDHPLSLAYCVPLEFRHYDLRCDICNIVLDPLPWVYFCGQCRFFIHVKCYWKKSPGKSSLVAKKEHNLVQLPWNDMSMDIIRPFIAKNSQIEIQPSEETKHFSHEHPLILSSSLLEITEEEKRSGEEKLCDGCVQPISIPYYHCAQCDYLIHTSCAHLPSELQHQCHPEHQLSLKILGRELGYFYCRSCKAKGNGFLYECKACEFQIDLWCAILPTKVIHEAHPHPLVQKVLLRGHPLTSPCIACGKKISGLIYRCGGDCTNFYMHYACTIMPQTVQHRWDKHHLRLSYPPFEDHTLELYCEICEEEIHPKHWRYHCGQCDQSFHLSCIPRIGKDCQIKFGHTLRVEDHQHPLKSIREGKYNFKCGRCGINLYGHGAFECEACQVSLCFKCVCNLPPEPEPEPGETGILPGQQAEDKKDPSDTGLREDGCAIL